MALLTIIKRFKHLHKPYSPIIRHFSQFPHRHIPHKLITTPLLESSALLFSQAFHRTVCRPFEHPRSFSCQTPYQIFNFQDHVGPSGEDVKCVLERVKKAKDFASGDEAIAFLDDHFVGVGKPHKDLIFSLIWALREEEWKLAFLVFKWGEKWGCVVEKTWCLMVWLLGNHKKFSTAWNLIHELHKASQDTQQAMLILIDRYAAANHPDKAIQTFHLMQKFKFSPDQKTYFTFLNILCQHGNIEEAEEFMFLNKKFFPLETEGFNIILNGWCNIAIDIQEAKRVWREMSKCCIEPDGTSYKHMISCFSSVCNLFDTLRLYDEMKKRGWTPGVEVYHSLVYVLTRENCLSEALKIVDRMKEAGLQPNPTTYNSIIRPLCETGKFEDARSVLASMTEDHISPNLETYHALLKGEDSEGTLGMLDHMRKDGFGPSSETFLLILDRFLKLDQPETALNMWLEMKHYMVSPSSAHYAVLVEGLAKCGLIAKARELYSDMLSIGLGDDLSLKNLLQEPGVRARKGKGHMALVSPVKRAKGRRSRVRTKRHRKQA